MINETNEVNEVKVVAKKLLKIIDKLVFIILLVIIFAMIFLLLNSKITGTEPSINGYKMYVVDSGSMTPTLKIGSLIFVKELKPLEIKIGDTITYRGADASVVTHRVTNIESNNGLRFITKGDANETEDPMPVESNRLVGKVVFSIAYLGFTLEFLKSKTGLILVSIIILVWIIAQSFTKHKGKVNADNKDEELESEK